MIEPLRHTEAVKGIELMLKGSNILKHTRNGLPHIRLIKLTPDYKFLVWFTASKSHAETSVSLESIEQI